MAGEETLLPTPASSRGTILIVDDSPDNLALLGNVLGGAGYLVRGAADGAQALKIAASRAPDLVLLDLRMPGMGGYEVCHRMRQEPLLRDIPVIVISAMDDVDDKVRAFEAGAVDYVTKPFHAPEVLARVGTHLQLSRLRRELERRQAELTAQNAELARANEELLRADRRTERVFCALAAALPGTVLDQKYRLVERIGAGGFATVFRAEHVQLRRPVAVKVFRPLAGNDNPRALERFQREGMAACRFSHPNAVAVLDCGISESGIAYLVMELLDGTTLSELLMEAPFSVARCVNIVRPVCEVLATAHEAGLVHRDVKPDNILLHRSPQGVVVKVLDFGIAKILGGMEDDAAAPLTRGVIGTPSYLAPERLRGAAYDGRADVYSVGVVLYQLLAGRLPYEVPRGQSLLAAILKSTDQPPPPLTAATPVPAAVERLVMRALAKDPANRPTAREMATSLLALET